jgi:hypothetical protein
MRAASPVHSGEEMVQFKAHGGNAVHVTGQVLMRPWVSEDADARVRVTVSGATLPATPAASSKKRAAADQKDSTAEQTQAKKQRRAEEASKREQSQAEAEEAKAAAAAEKQKAAEKLRRKKEQQAAEEAKEASQAAAAKKEKEKEKEKEKRKAEAAAKAAPQPFIQSRKFTGAKKGKSRQPQPPGTASPAPQFAPRCNFSASREMRISHYD